MNDYSAKFDKIKKLTDYCENLIFLMQNNKEKIKFCGFFSASFLFLLVSTIYTDGIQSLIFKLAFTSFIIIFTGFVYFIVQHILTIRDFYSILLELKTFEIAMDNHLHRLKK